MKRILLLLVFICLPILAQAAHTVNLTWTQTTDPVALNCVFKATTAGGENLVGTPLFCSTAPITAYTDSAVTAGDQWFYVVTAVSSKGVSSPASNEANAVVPLLPVTSLQAVPK
jgi:fibronectin type 3 domain-containing protein